MEVSREGGDGEELTAIEAEECDAAEVGGRWVVEQAIAMIRGLSIFFYFIHPASILCVYPYISFDFFGFLLLQFIFTFAAYASSFQASMSNNVSKP